MLPSVKRRPAGRRKLIRRGLYAFVMVLGMVCLVRWARNRADESDKVVSWRVAALHDAVEAVRIGNGRVHRAVDFKLDPERGLGAYCTESVDKGEELFAVPFEMLITSARTWSEWTGKREDDDPKHDDGDEEEEDHDPVKPEVEFDTPRRTSLLQIAKQVALRLSLDADDVYLNSLPPCREILASTKPVLADKELDDIFNGNDDEARASSYSAGWPESREINVCALLLVQTRVHYVHPPRGVAGDPILAMVPLADMINYKSREAENVECRTVAGIPSEGGGGQEGLWFSCRASRGVGKGEFLFAHYRAREPSTFRSSWGF